MKTGLPQTDSLFQIQLSTSWPLNQEKIYRSMEVL